MIRYTKRAKCLPKVDTNGTEHWVEYIEVSDKKAAEEKLCQLEDLMEKYNIKTPEQVESSFIGFVTDYTEEGRNHIGELLKLEDELGIDLITLIKAMKNGVYVISYDEGIVFEEPMLGFNQENKTNLYVLDGVCHMPPDELCKSSNYYLKDYGKTWALTKEELE